MPKVLQVGRYFPPHVGGVETLVYNLTHGLNSRGIHCDVLCSNKDAVYKLDQFDRFKVHRTRSYGQVLSVSVTPQLISKFRKISSQYDIVHLHHPDPVATLALFMAKPSCKVVVHWHSDILRQKIPLILFKPLQSWMLRRADAIIATSPNYAMGSAHLAPFRKKVTVIPIGIEPLHGNANGKESRIGKTWAGKKKVVFSLGRLVYYKGFEQLIDAASFLDDSYVVLIGGTGPLRKRLQNRINTRGLSEKVILLGEIPPGELADYYDLADVFCLPSTYKTEAFGIVLLEAMSFGKPLVTTDLPDSGISWVNRNHITGLTVPPNDALKLAQAIKTIASDEGLARQFSTAARERFYEKFTSNAMVESTIKLYSSIMGAEKKREFVPNRSAT
ncbi:MAG: glycosyltransferase [Cyclobacteriaceae bacterium]|nr:glycosyltransferase [Cyclobacteriaceae bacterium]